MIVHMCMCMSVDRLAPLAALGSPPEKSHRLSLHCSRATRYSCVPVSWRRPPAHTMSEAEGVKVGAAIASNASKMPLTQQSGQ